MKFIKFFCKAFLTFRFFLLLDSLCPFACISALQVILVGPHSAIFQIFKKCFLALFRHFHFSWNVFFDKINSRPLP
jgi:hypothetical protein